MIFQFLFFIFLVFLAFYFIVAYVLWRNLRLYSVPGTVPGSILNLSFLIPTLVFTLWAIIALLQFL